ncbi:hydantoinase, partial [Moniliophthora roreri]
MAAPLPSFSV